VFDGPMFDELAFDDFALLQMEQNYLVLYRLLNNLQDDYKKLKSLIYYL
jgi:hypothetical protein